MDITLKDIESVLDDLNGSYKKDRSFKFYTDTKGAEQFDLAFTIYKYEKDLKDLNLPKEQFNNIHKLLFSNLTENYTLAIEIINNLKNK